jgi:hypothetical protein
MRLIVNITAMSCLLMTATLPAHAQSDRRTGSLLGGFAAPSQPAAPPAQPVAWANKAAFLEAARRGELAGIHQLAVAHRQAEFEPVLNAITHLLQTDYGVGPFLIDRNCYMEYSSAARDLMRMVNELLVGSLGQQGPDFRIPRSNAALRDRAQTVNRAGGWCTTDQMGRESTPPYKKALIQLMEEYAGATQEWVEAERGRRVTAFQQEQSRQASERSAAGQEVERRKAESREAQQREIDAQRQRIEAEQQRRQQIEKKRIAG